MESTNIVTIEDLMSPYPVAFSDPGMIYRYIYLPLGITCYVGLTVYLEKTNNRRDKQHRRPRKKMQCPRLETALKAHPKDYVFEVVGYFDRNILGDAEVYFIDKYGTYFYDHPANPWAYNGTKGGSFSSPLPPDKVAENVQKSVTTKREKGLYPEISKRIVATRKANGSYITGSEKSKSTKLLRGTNKPAGKKMIATKRKLGIIEVGIQKSVATKKANNTYATSVPKAIATLRSRDDYEELCAKIGARNRELGIYDRLKIENGCNIYVRTSSSEVIYANQKIAETYLGIARATINTLVNGRNHPGKRLAKKLASLNVLEIRKATPEDFSSDSFSNDKFITTEKTTDNTPDYEDVKSRDTAYMNRYADQCKAVVLGVLDKDQIQEKEVRSVKLAASILGMSPRTLSGILSNYRKPGVRYNNKLKSLGIAYVKFANEKTRPV